MKPALILRLLKANFLVLLVLSSWVTKAQDTAKFTKPQKAYLYGASSALFLGHTGLYSLWYKDYPQSKFHFINDNRQWLQMDKYGHSFSTYVLSDVGFETCKSLGFTENQALIYGGLLGVVFQTPIEIFDGFSANWGASTGDFVANTAGWGLFFVQQKLFQNQIVRLKWSYINSGLAYLRPNVLGSNWNERILKDYNGQTYWASVNMKSIFKRSKIPAWLNVGIGFGAEGMIGGEDNYIRDKNTGILLQDYSSIQRYRTYDLSLDIDFSKVKTTSKLLKGLFRYINWLKAPFPSIQYSQPNGLDFRALGY